MLKFKTKSILLLLSIGVFISGCSTKNININQIAPPKVTSLSGIKNIAVLKFKNDKIGFSGKLESYLSKSKINGKKVFNVVDRKNMTSILKELKFQSSDLVTNKIAKFGKLVGAQAIITGSVNYTYHNGKSNIPIIKCVLFDKKFKCLNYKTSYITCKTSNAYLSVSINTISVNTGKILDSKTFTKTYKGNSCKPFSDYVRGEIALEQLSSKIAKEYYQRIAPHKISLNVTLIDEVKSIKLNDNEEKMFDNALTYIEDGRIKNANLLLKKLNSKLNNRSYEVLYNLGLTEEALGNLIEAKLAYNLADKIILDNNLKPDENVDNAVKRINSEIKEKKILDNIINKK